MLKRYYRLHRTAGFTLVELMVSIIILLLVILMIMGFFIESSKINFDNEHKNLVNRTIRRVTAQMAQDARESSYFLLYNSFTTSDRDNNTKRLIEGNGGNFVLFVLLGNYTAAVTDARPITQLIGYFLTPEANSTGPVRRFSITLPANSYNEPESYIPSFSTANNYPKVMENAQGLAKGKLFYNYLNKTVMVNGKIVQGNTNRAITGAFNFSISSRG